MDRQTDGWMKQLLLTPNKKSIGCNYFLI